MTNTFNTLEDLRIGDESIQFYSLPALERAGVGNVARLPYSLKILLENLLRHEDGRSVSADDISVVAGWDATGTTAHEIAFTPARVLLQDFTGRAGAGRSRGDAGWCAATGWRSEPRQSAAAGRARHRPFGPGRSFWQSGRVAVECRPRVLPESRAVCVPAVGTERVRELSGRPARHRDRPPGQSRAPGARCVPRVGRRSNHGVPRHAGGDRLAHDDGQWPGRRRLGCGGHRGRGGDAGAGDLDAGARRRRCSLERGS